MAERAGRPRPRYRVVCYELLREGQQVVMDATDAGFVAGTAVISAGRLQGELVSAGPQELQTHLALRIASDDWLAGR